MAAQKMPLGHKRRGEAEFANNPSYRAVRGRYARAMRAQAAAKAGQSDRATSGFMGTGGGFDARRSPGVVAFRPLRVAVGGFHG